jgi:hypothetical protein
MHHRGYLARAPRRCCATPRRPATSSTCGCRLLDAVSRTAGNDIVQIAQWRAVRLDRRLSCLTRCITAQRDRGRRDCSTDRARELEHGRRDQRNLVCLARLERALNALSTRSLCQLGYRHDGGPGRIRTCGGHRQRIKSPPRSAATVTGPWRTRVVTIHMPTG